MHTPLEERICQLCYEGVEFDEHYDCHYIVFHQIRGRFHCVFNQGFDLQRKEMEYEDTVSLRPLLPKLKRHEEKLKDNTTTTQAH